MSLWEFRIRRLRVQLLVLLASLVLACNGGSESSDAGPVADAGDAGCAPGLQAHGLACAPIFDRCAADEVPLLGGGCKRVGVRECDGGLAAPPDWTCKRIGPPTSCSKGWKQVRRRWTWCEPVLPAASCPAGKIEVLGQATCQPIGSCGSGTYGAIKTGSKTIHVDATYRGGGSDGSASKPHTTLGAALEAASSGGQIAVAAGTYQEDLVIDKAVTIEGRCAEEVTLKGKTDWAAVAISAGKTTLRGLTVTGPAAGIWIDKAKLTLQRVAVQSCGGVGITASGGATVSVGDSLVADNAELGVWLDSSTVELERCVVRGTRSTGPNNVHGQRGTAIFATRTTTAPSLTLVDSLIADNRHGGIKIVAGEASLLRTVIRNNRSQADGGRAIEVGTVTSPAVLRMRDCVVAGNEYAGIELQRSRGTIEQSVVRDCRPRQGDSRKGYGIWAETTSAQFPSKLIVRDSLVTGNHDTDLGGADSEVTVERTVVQDTKAAVSGMDGWWHSVLVEGWRSKKARLVVRDSLIQGGNVAGIAALGGDATVERTVVRETRPQGKDDLYGFGIFSACMVKTRFGLDSPCRSGPPPKLVVSDSLIASNHTTGIVVLSYDAMVTRTVIRDTAPQAADMVNGLGLTAEALEKLPSTVTMTDSVVSGSRTVGIYLAGSSATLKRVAVRDTRPQASDRAHGAGVSAQVVDGLPSSLTMSESLVADSHTVGIDLVGASATLKRVAVQDTLPQVSDKKHGFGVLARQRGQRRSTLVMEACAVRGSRTSGVGVASSTAKISQVLVDDTRLDEAEGINGEGISVVRYPAVGATLDASLALSDSLVDRSAGAGLLYYDAGGSVHGSVFRRGTFSIDLEQGARPEIGADNRYELNKENRITWGQNLAPPPLPPPPPRPPK